MGIDLTREYPTKRYKFSIIDKGRKQAAISRRRVIKQVLNDNVNEHIRSFIKRTTKDVVDNINKTTNRNFQPDEVYISAFTKLRHKGMRCLPVNRTIVSVCYFNQLGKEIETLHFEYILTDFDKERDKEDLLDTLFEWLRGIRVEYKSSLQLDLFNSRQVIELEPELLGLFPGNIDVILTALLKDTLSVKLTNPLDILKQIQGLDNGKVIVTGIITKNRNEALAKLLSSTDSWMLE